MSYAYKKKMKKCLEWLDDYSPGSVERERIAELLQMCGEALHTVAHLEHEVGRLYAAGILLKKEYDGLKKDYGELKIMYRDAKDLLDTFDDDLK